MVFRNLRGMREQANLTQEQVAKILGIAQNTYSQYENGKIALVDEHLLKLADFYRTSVDYLMDRTNDPTPPQ